MKGRGIIERNFFAICGNCEDGVHADGRTMKQAISNLRNYGWKYTKEHGWTCPDCLKEAENDKRYYS